MASFARKSVAMVKVYLEDRPCFVFGLTGARPLTDVVDACHTFLLTNPAVEQQPALTKVTAKTNPDMELYLELYFQSNVGWAVPLPEIKIH